MTVNEEIQAVLECKSSSYWLRDALKSALSRDSVDAANDAEHLSDLLSRRCNSVLQSVPVANKGDTHESSL
ncbi:hypothetical protein ALP73_01118 [Pseudomonas coronafaciens pv. garcae]|uniref:hypothetical protein n=1 Tax=Pseudomonas syringae group TaxID=136849 RepID=UPI000F003DA1|nr:hypothetical protein [Pseudomonas coronafaciens]RMS09312.1 hypothetical protein ALP73_01118 [Pseudomonas coronafaciens pv. garcae]